MFLYAVVRYVLPDQLPKCGRMVQMDPVRDLVDDKVIDGWLWRHYDAPVVIYIPQG